MKIAILTLPLHTNYGGILQAYALQTILERNGHQVVIVDKDRYKPAGIYHQLRSLLIYIRKGFAKEYKPNWAYNKIKRKREINTRDFVNRYINIYSIRYLATEFPHNIDAIVVGSDQIWRKQLFRGMIDGELENAYLSFTQGWNVKRIAYAASFGTDEWEYTAEESKQCAQLIEAFNAVGVRELTGVELCSKYLHYQHAKHVLDPTLLLDKVDYESLVKNGKTKSSEGNLMVYILDDTEEKKALVNKIATERNFKPFRANQSDDIFRNDPNAVQPPVEQWLRGFMDADFVVTDSFHACVFSIIFRKPFVALANQKRGGARFSSLLSMFDVMQNLISSIDEYDSNLSYEITDKSLRILEVKRKESIDFLRVAL